MARRKSELARIVGLSSHFSGVHGRACPDHPRLCCLTQRERRGCRAKRAHEVENFCSDPVPAPAMIYL